VLASRQLAAAATSSSSSSCCSRLKRATARRHHRYAGVQPQFAVNFFLLRKVDNKQFALCAGSSQDTDGSYLFVSEDDGLARRPDRHIEVDEHDEERETYRWLIERPYFANNDEQDEWERAHGYKEAQVTRIELDLMQEDDYEDWDYKPEKRLTQVTQVLQLIEQPMFSHRWV
jgi:hypothetical protein